MVKSTQVSGVGGGDQRLSSKFGETDWTVPTLASAVKNAAEMIGVGVGRWVAVDSDFSYERLTGMGQ